MRVLFLVLFMIKIKIVDFLLGLKKRYERFTFYSALSTLSRPVDSTRRRQFELDMAYPTVQLAQSFLFIYG